jgi:hypothetical protein
VTTVLKALFKRRYDDFITLDLGAGRLGLYLSVEDFFSRLLARVISSWSKGNFLASST